MPFTNSTMMLDSNQASETNGRISTVSKKTTSNTNNKPLLFSYVRFSTTEQAKGKSLERQLTYARKVAEERGLTLDENLTMKDLGKSGFHQDNVKNGALGSFLDAINDNLVPKGSILIIESLDRLSRANPWQSQAILAQIIEADITLITAIDGKEYNSKTIKENSMNLIFIVLVFIRAHEESVVKSERATGTILQKCRDWVAGKRGFKVDCGKPPKWLKWCNESKQFVFVPREKEIMLRKIELYRQGHGGLKMAQILNEEFGDRTVHHTAANVYKEVRRRSLIGEFNVKVKVSESAEESYTLENYFPPLLTLSEFNQLINDSNCRAAAKAHQKFIGILSGSDIFKCGCCGKAVGSHVIYRNKKLKNIKDSHKTYNCSEARRQNNCNNKDFVYITAAEKAVTNYCKDGVNLRRVLSSNNAKTPLVEELDALLREKSAIEKESNDFLEILTTLKSKPKLIITKINKLESQLETIDQKIESIQSKLNKISTKSSKQISNKWLQLTGDIENLSNDERQNLRLLIKDTFHSIILHPVSFETSDGISKEINALRDELLKTEVNHKDYADLTLRFHSGLIRIMRIDKRTGELIKGFDLT